MAAISRRQVMKATASGMAATLASQLVFARSSNAKPLNLEIGLQLYSLGSEMEKDFEGTLKAIAAIGYREVETTKLAYGTRDAKQIATFLQSLELGWKSSHTSIPALQAGAEQIIASAKEAGLAYLICPTPWTKDPTGSGRTETHAGAILDSLTLDDWKWSADFLNKAGEQIKRAGVQLGYHNHEFDFRTYDGVVAYDELIRLTDPNLVKLELDCGWMVNAGYDPVTYLERFPNRYRLLHIKDLRPNSGRGSKVRTTEVGSGTIDWKKIFAAARSTEVAGYYVEWEPPFERPGLESARISYNYLQSLTL
jgi:sugar phosphate isomerase/epimerase